MRAHIEAHKERAYTYAQILVHTSLEAPSLPEGLRQDMTDACMPVILELTCTIHMKYADVYMNIYIYM